jgi:decaprenylphospho-beta-D-ribofuranose 2-oxidase
LNPEPRTLNFERYFVMKLHGWGRYPRIEAEAAFFESAGQAAALLARPGHWIAHGFGKSYGDSALNPRVLMTRRHNKLLDFDPERGIVTCESGVTLAELIAVFMPKGWFPGVIPGTKLITIGGAIASDVHGKNHHTAGCFSASVLSLRLMLPDGRMLQCSSTENPDLFRATCGGMGLTGLILDATLQLQPVRSAYIRETVIRCSNLSHSFEQFEINRHISYSVAWIDCLATGDALGRSILMLGEQDEDGGLDPPPVRSASVPVECPHFVLNPWSAALFNQLYFHTHPSRVKARRTSIDSFFFPLDRIAHWNRLYGARGFTQYQCVLPKSASLDGLRCILSKIAASGIGSFLAVLKLLGLQNENPLSFPMEGYTLALDFKVQPRLFPLLNELDRMVLDHGGRLYLAKDVRMTRETFRAGYPRWETFLALRNQYGLGDKINSLQGERLGLSS